MPNPLPTHIPCYWIEPAGRIVMHLRRFVHSGTETCPGPMGYHDASVTVGEQPSTNDLTDKHRTGMSWDLAQRYNDPADFWGAGITKDDPRWPVQCAGCGRRFVDEDEWQLTAKDVYRNPSTGEEMERSKFPAGAVYRATWYEDTSWVGPDGYSIAITVPDTLGRTRAWTPDVPAGDGNAWQRTGDPMKPETLTVRPSILFTSSPRFHAWLTNGKLEILSDTESWE